MTPGEKQAIIDKALELGFEPYLKDELIYLSRFDVCALFFNTEFCYISLGVDEDVTYLLKRISSPSDLETLFNAIVS